MKEFRKKNKMTLVDLGENTGFTKGYLSMIENGKTDKLPSFETLQKIEKGLNAPFGFLLEKAGYIDTSDVDFETREWFYSNLEDVLDEITVNGEFAEEIKNDIKDLEDIYQNVLEVDEKITPTWIKKQIEESTYRSEWIINLIGDLRSISKKHNLHLDLNTFLLKNNITFKGKVLTDKQKSLIQSYTEALVSE